MLSMFVLDSLLTKRGDYAWVMSRTPYLTIGEFSRRVGVSVDLLRAWERRYGVPRPIRTANGRRLYTREDELVVHGMRRSLDRGIPAAEAARLAAASGGEPPARP